LLRNQRAYIIIERDWRSRSAQLNRQASGGEIVREATTQSISLAVIRGMASMFLSLLLYCLLISSLTAILNWSAGYGLVIFIKFMLVGLIGFGWLVALVGAIGGWLLYRVSCGTGQQGVGVSDGSLSGDD
jgi:hypothetical protein